MFSHSRRLLALAPLCLLAGCGAKSVVPAGAEAIAVPQGASTRIAPDPDYRFGVGDELRVTVFREPDLSLDKVIVDPAGFIDLPAIGQVTAAGRTAGELTSAVASALNRRLLRNARVSIGPVRLQSRVVTVDGSVKSSGVYPMTGRMTLMQAVALGGGAALDADLGNVVVFRNIDGQRMAARFDLREIRNARAPDPEVLPHDVVVVGLSRAKMLYRDLLQVLPGLAGVFVALEQN